MSSTQNAAIQGHEVPSTMIETTAAVQNPPPAHPEIVPNGVRRASRKVE
jgi:hypothetical protein